MTSHSPIDIDSVIPPDDEEDYLRWRRARIQAALADPRPSIPHAQVMKGIQERFMPIQDPQEVKAEK